MRRFTASLLQDSLAGTWRAMRWVCLTLIILLALSWLMIAFDMLSGSIEIDGLGRLNAYSAMSALTAAAMLGIALFLFLLRLLYALCVSLWRYIRSHIITMLQRGEPQ